jgi:hypothetical protein
MPATADQATWVRDEEEFAAIMAKFDNLKTLIRALLGEAQALIAESRPERTIEEAEDLAA